jgi:23S rRNA pseudouridine955/2504/2580 synthase
MFILKVLDKPAGLACQGGSKSKIHLELLLKSINAHGLEFKLVHRLDRDTTGILLIATNTVTAQRLNKLFRESKVIKTVIFDFNR